MAEFGTDHPGDGVCGHQPGALQKPKKGAQGRKLARHRGAGVGGVERADKGLHHGSGDGVGLGHRAAGAEELADVALVAVGGVGRIPLFRQQPGDESLDRVMAKEMLKPTGECLV